MSSENHRNRLGTKPPDRAGVISSFIPQAEHLVLSLGGGGAERGEALPERLGQDLLVCTVTVADLALPHEGTCSCSVGGPSFPRSWEARHPV